MSEQPRPQGMTARIIATVIIGALFVAACACPAIEFVDPPRAHDFGEINIFPDFEMGTHVGLTALLFGWDFPWTVPWSANLVLLAGWICLLYRKNSYALGFGSAAMLLGLSTWGLFFHDHDLHHLQQLMIGYYLWQASFLALAAAGLILWLREPPDADEFASQYR